MLHQIISAGQISVVLIHRHSSQERGASQGLDMAGRAGYHTVGKIKKIQEENRGTVHTSHSSLLQSPGAALSEVFAKFDLSGDGTISIAEYRTLCQARAGYSNMRMGDIGVPL